MNFQFESLSYNVFIVDEPIEDKNFYKDVKQILNENEVNQLPAYFYNIDTLDDAKDWLEFMSGEVDLFFMQGKYSLQTIGFIFMHTLPNKQTHLGYLLAQEYWNKGIITEVLMEFMQYVNEVKKWNNIVAGVEKENTASIELLEKLGFNLKNDGSIVSIYEYKID